MDWCLIAFSSCLRIVPMQPGTPYVRALSYDSISVRWGPPTTTANLNGYQLSLCPDNCDDVSLLQGDLF